MANGGTRNDHVITGTEHSEPILSLPSLGETRTKTLIRQGYLPSPPPSGRALCPPTQMASSMAIMKYEHMSDSELQRVVIESRKPTDALYDRVGASSTETPGVYETIHFAPSQDLYRSWLAHLLQYGGGPFGTLHGTDFNTAVWEFNEANMSTLAQAPLDPAEEASIAMKTMEDSTLNVDEERAAITAGKLQSCYEASMVVAVKFGHMLPTKSARSDCSARVLGAPVTMADINSPNFPWTAENYHLYPMPTKYCSQIARRKAHPAWNVPLHPSQGWTYKQQSDCYNVPGYSWVPPTACPLFRIKLVHHLYTSILNHDGIFDKPNTRVYKQWFEVSRDHREPGTGEVTEQGNGLERLELAAWRMALKLHKVHRYHERDPESKLGFWDKMGELSLTLKLCKGACWHTTCHSLVHHTVNFPKEKRMTFKYNQDSNKRKKEREQNHVDLFEKEYGHLPEWKIKSRKKKSVAKHLAREVPPTTSEMTSSVPADPSGMPSPTPTEQEHDNQEESLASNPKRRKRSAQKSQTQSKGQHHGKRQRATASSQRRLAPAPARAVSLFPSAPPQVIDSNIGPGWRTNEPWIENSATDCSIDCNQVQGPLGHDLNVVHPPAQSSHQDEQRVVRQSFQSCSDIPPYPSLYYANSGSLHNPHISQQSAPGSVDPRILQMGILHSQVGVSQSPFSSPTRSSSILAVSNNTMNGYAVAEAYLHGSGSETAIENSHARGNLPWDNLVPGHNIDASRYSFHVDSESPLQTNGQAPNAYGSAEFGVQGSNDNSGDDNLDLLFGGLNGWGDE